MLRARTMVVYLGIAAALTACQGGTKENADDTARLAEAGMNGIAESYVKLVLAIGEHDAAYVDAYHGPPQWRTAEKMSKRPLDLIHAEATMRKGEVDALAVSGADAMLSLRKEYLSKQLGALIAYVDILGGKTMRFDEESEALFDAVAPTHDSAYFQSALDQLDQALPGEGTVQERYEHFRKQFYIPEEKLDAVFEAAIDECRKRTLARMSLPENERFEIEYVGDKPWSGYNWYKGNSYSLIQVNTDFPISISRAIDLACHEGYPGHHVYNLLLENRLYRQRGWVEFSIYALFSPQSLIAEGSANFGIEVAFPKDERVTYEREVLFPLAGLDPSQAERFYQVQELIDRLSYAGNEAARGYLDGDMTSEVAQEWLTRYALMTSDRAAQRIKFIDTYRTYVINYNLGKDLVRAYIEGNGGTSSAPDRRWEIFADLLSSPRLPSGLN